MNSFAQEKKTSRPNFLTTLKQLQTILPNSLHPNVEYKFVSLRIFDECAECLWMAF